MLTTIEILDSLKTKLTSDYKAARVLKISDSRMYELRKGGGTLTDDQGLRAAKELGLSEELIISSLVAERSKNSPAYLILKRIADHYELKKTTAAALLMTVVFLSIYAPLPGFTA